MFLLFTTASDDNVLSILSNTEKLIGAFIGVVAVASGVVVKSWQKIKELKKESKVVQQELGVEHNEPNTETLRALVDKISEKVSLSDEVREDQHRSNRERFDNLGGDMKALSGRFDNMERMLGRILLKMANIP